MSRTVACSRSVSRCTRSWNSRRAAGSKPAVGSSRNSSSGRPTMPMATSSRRRCPPDRLPILAPRLRRSGRRDRAARRCPTAGGISASRTGRSSRPGAAAARGPATSRGPARTAAPRRRGRATARPPRAGSVPSTLNLPGGPHPEPLEDLDRGGLPRAVRPEQRDDFPGADVEVDAGQDLLGPVPHPQVAHFRCNIRHHVQKIADLLHLIKDLYPERGGYSGPPRCKARAHRPTRWPSGRTRRGSPRARWGSAASSRAPSSPSRWTRRGPRSSWAAACP